MQGHSKTPDRCGRERIPTRFEIAIQLRAGSWSPGRYVSEERFWDPGYFELDWPAAFNEADLALGAYQESVTTLAELQCEPKPCEHGTPVEQEPCAECYRETDAQLGTLEEGGAS